MLLLYVLLSVALDMSLPEFQPEIDLSGNYIIGEFDLSDGEFEVTEAGELPDGMTVEAPAEEVDDISNDDIEFELTLLRSDGNYLSLTTQRNTEIQLIEDLYYIKQRSSYNYYIQYFLLSSGVSYDIDAYGEVFIGNSIDYDSQVYLYTNNKITPENDIYIIQYHHTNYYMNISISDNSGNDVSGDDISGGDASGDDITNNNPDNPSVDNNNYNDLLNELKNIQMQLRCILFVCIWKFILPLAMKIRDHVFGLKHE